LPRSNAIYKSKQHATPTLNLESLSDDARSSLSVFSLAPCNVLSIIGSDDVLARLGVIHLGFLMGEESVEEPVEDHGGDEGVDVTNGEAGQDY
jgi:hypothetical protein